MQPLHKFKTFLALGLIFFVFGCDVKARLSDLPPTANSVNFAVLSDNKLKGIAPNIEKRKTSTYYIEEKSLFYKYILIEKLRVALMTRGYDVIEVNERCSALFAKKKTSGYYYNAFVGVYYQIDSTQNKTSIFLQMQHSKESRGWTPDDAADIGASIERVLHEK